MMVPISAHALFARPMVVAPTSVMAVEVLARTEGAGVLWCDGRRTVDLPPGARIEVRRGGSAGAPGPAARGAVHRPAGRQVRAAGRGLARRQRAAPSRQRRGRMLEEIRIGSLGVIDSSTLELGPGLTVITGETGAGKTMIVTALGLLLGGRADSGAVRTGARTARVEGVVSAARLARLRRGGRGGRGRGRGRPGRAGPQRLGRGPLPRVRRRRLGAGVRAGRGRRAAGRGARPVRPAPAAPGRARSARRSTGSAASRSPSLLADYAGLHDRLRATERELDEVVATARERAREADLLRFGLGEVEAVAPEPGEDAALAAEEARLGFADTLRTAAEQAREALSSDAGRSPTRWPPRRPPAPSSTASATTTPRPASWPTGWPRSPTCSPTSPPTSRPTPPGSRPTRPGWPPSPSAGRR